MKVEFDSHVPVHLVLRTGIIRPRNYRFDFPSQVGVRVWPNKYKRACAVFRP